MPRCLGRPVPLGEVLSHQQVEVTLFPDDDGTTGGRYQGADLFPKEPPTTTGAGRGTNVAPASHVAQAHSAHSGSSGRRGPHWCPTHVRLAKSVALFRALA